MDEQDYIERLKTTPVTETGFGNARTRRVIKNAGFNTLWELFNLSEKEIDDRFEPDVADKIIDLRDQYRTNPEKFVSSVLQKGKGIKRPSTPFSQRRKPLVPLRQSRALQQLRVRFFRAIAPPLCPRRRSLTH